MVEKSSHPSGFFVLAAAALLSFAAGFANGLLGAGSGIIFMLVSRIVNKNDADGKSMYSFSIMCVIPVALLSLFMYEVGYITFTEILQVAPIAIVGGVLGALIKEKINAAYLGLAFAAITVYSGISMIVRA